MSVAQAQEITRAETDTPGAEVHLLKVARHADLSKVRDEAKEHKLHNTDPSELHQKQDAARCFRHWQDRLGMVCFAGALPPVKGVPFIRRLEAEARRIHDEAKKKGESASFEAHAADALCQMVSGKGKSTSERAELVVVCDLFACRRGHAHRDEVCHIVGGGPIPVDVVRELSRDAFIKAVLHDGVEIHTVKHFGRHLPAVLRTALELGHAPMFKGATCADCGNRLGLEYDHVNPIANSGPTEYANLKARCWREPGEDRARP